MRNDEGGRPSPAAADPHVVEHWVKGWTLARGTPPPVEDSGGWRVDVGWPDQRMRYVFARLAPEILSLAGRIADPWIFLKACVPVEELRRFLPPVWSVRPPGFMMTWDEPMRAVMTPAGYSLELVDARTVSVARIRAATGEEAAIGRVALSGGFAIYDRIETHPDHRRRGLGRAVMGALASVAVSRGGTRGVLVATAQGRLLYESLGWRMHSPYATAFLPG